MQEPQPQLAELLRTCVHPSSLLLRVVHIEFLEVRPRQKGSFSDLADGPDRETRETCRYAVKLLLSDGELMIQALLHRKLVALRDVADVVVGDLLDIRQFAVKKSRSLAGHCFVVYLAIEDCHFLQQVRPLKSVVAAEEEPLCAKPPLKRKRTLSQSVSEHPGTVQLGAPRDVLASNLDNDMPAVIGRPQEMSSGHGFAKAPYAEQCMSHYEDEDDDFFETSSTNRAAIIKRRKVLQRLDGNASITSQGLSPESDFHLNDAKLPSHDKWTSIKQATTPLNEEPLFQEARPKDPIDAIQPQPQPQPQPQSLAKQSVRDGTFTLSQTPTSYLPPLLPVAAKAQPPQRHVQTQPNPQPPTQLTLLPPPPFHTLSSLRNPPPSSPLPAKSYTLTTLAIISWTGSATIHRPGSPFPPKRHLKITDPSLSASRPPSRHDQAGGQQHPHPETGVPTFKSQNSFQDAVTVAVYIDAANFKPRAGTLVLFRGLVMQRLGNGDIILNAYGRLKEQRFEDDHDHDHDRARARPNTDRAATGLEGEGGVGDGDGASLDNHWFVTDHSRIRKLGHGSILDCYLEWWSEKQRGNMSAQN